MKIKKCIILFLIIISSKISFSQHYNNDMDQCDIIVESAKALDVGFPFNTVKRLKYNQFTYQIGKNIYELNRDGFLDPNQRAKNLNDIIEYNWRVTDKHPLEGYLNVGYVMWSEPKVDVYLLFAAFTLAAQKGEIINIVPFLDFSKVFFGTDAEAFVNPGDVTSLGSAYLDRLANKDLTKQERMSFWPAANAILSNPTTTIPLLADAVRNNELPELLRLRAAAYLREMAPELLSGELMKKTEPAFAKKIQCIIDKKSKWDSVGVNVCAPFDENIAKQFKAKMDRLDALREERRRTKK